MNSVILIIQLVVQYGLPAIDSIAKVVAKWGCARNVPLSEWVELRDNFGNQPEYWTYVQENPEETEP